MSVYSFPCFSVFSTYSSSCRVNFSLFFFIFKFYRHIPCPTVCISYFPPFSVFLDIFQVLQCVSHFKNLKFFFAHSRFYNVHFSFFKFFSVSRLTPGPTVFVSHFPRFSVFSQLSRLYSVYFSFFTFLLFLAIFQVLQCMCHIFLLCQFSRHIPGPTVCVSHFP